MKKKMFYFVNTEKSIEKYLVNFDEEKIKELKQELILNCGSLNHRKYKNVIGPMEETDTIKNLKIEKVGKCKYNIGKEECCEDPEFDVYSFEYDEYVLNEKHKLVKKNIDGLLNYDVKSLNNIFESIYADENTIEAIKKNIEILRERQEYVGEYGKLAIQKSINDYTESLIEAEAELKLSKYHEKLLGLIKLSIYSEMCLEDINMVEKFFGIDIIHDDAHVYEINENFEKVIK